MRAVGRWRVKGAVRGVVMVEAVAARAVRKQVGAVTGFVKGQVVAVTGLVKGQVVAMRGAAVSGDAVREDAVRGAAVRGAGAVRRHWALVEQGEWHLAEGLDWLVADAQTHAGRLFYLDL